MVTVGILAILASIAVPSFNRTITSNQIVAQTNALVSALTLARSEASKRGIAVTVCGDDGSGVACSGGTTWNNGWIVFADSDRNGSYDVGADTILQLTPTANSTLSTVATNTVVTYSQNGSISTSTSFTITKSGCGIGQKRILTIGISGMTKIDKQDCP
jgi:type IV fimbrial biogenesis protein FimT